MHCAYARSASWKSAGSPDAEASPEPAAPLGPGLAAAEGDGVGSVRTPGPAAPAELQAARLMVRATSVAPAANRDKDRTEGSPVSCVGPPGVGLRRRLVSTAAGVLRTDPESGLNGRRITAPV